MEASAIIPALFGLAGVAVGGVVQYFITKKQDGRDRAFQERQLAGAFLGEVSAVRKIILFRGYLPAIDENVARLSNGEDVPLKCFRAKRDYDSVYRANVERLGGPPHAHPREAGNATHRQEFNSRRYGQS